MKFYLPNFEDLVDPEYDFINDEYSPKREKEGRYNHDWYAHQFFDEPIFDGMLVSKTVVTASAEKRIRESGNLHAYCRLDTKIPIMGDCGAFTYFEEDVPPYSVSEILAYYSELGFSSGVSIDHVIFASMPNDERERRLEITLQNAEAFLAQHKAEGHRFTPVGIAQGWDPHSRRQAIEWLLDMGYKHLALGGMVRSRDKEIRATLEAIHPILPEGVHFHLFGIARLSILPDLVRLGVTSADSASPIRRAFLGTGEDNYWATDGTRYAAIRVPTAEKDAAKKRGVISTEEILENNGVNLDSLRKIEQNALDLLRSYARGETELEETLAAVLEYDRLYGDKRDHEKAYRRTLSKRPWQTCGCPICEKWGIEVVIFRGNNRNRRRGFHNAKVFYDLFRGYAESPDRPSAHRKGNYVQIPLDLR
jgi:hypothetical protein